MGLDEESKQVERLARRLASVLREDYGDGEDFRYDQATTCLNELAEAVSDLHTAAASVRHEASDDDEAFTMAGHIIETAEDLLSVIERVDSGLEKFRLGADVGFYESDALDYITSIADLSSTIRDQASILTGMSS